LWLFAGVLVAALTSAIGAATSSTSTTTSLSIGTVFNRLFFTGATNNGVLFCVFLPYDPRIIYLFRFVHLFHLSSLLLIICCKIMKIIYYAR